MWSIFCTIKRSWSQHFVEQFSAFIIMTMSFSALFFIALALTNVQNLFEMWGQVNQVTVYLQPDTKSDDKSMVIASLNNNPMVTSFQEVTSQESAKKFEKRFAKVTSQKIDANHVSKFFPSYLVVELNHEKAYKSGLGALDQFAFDLKTEFNSVRNVSYGKSWLQRYVGLLSAFQWIGWFLIVSFLIASVIVASSVIKTILFSRRDEIEILEFIGADDQTIYLPQVINTLLLSTVVFLTALLANFILYIQIKEKPIAILSSSAQSQLSFISPGILATIGFLAISSVAIYSMLTIFNMLPRRKKALLIKGVMD